MKLENEFDDLNGEVAVELCANKKDGITNDMRENIKERCELQEENNIKEDDIDKKDLAQLRALNAQLRNKRRKTESDKVNDEARATQTGMSEYSPDDPYPNNKKDKH